MRHLSIAALSTLLAATAAPVAAQQHQHADTARPRAASPYTQYAGREIKALAPEQIAQYRAGEGMGFALAAELNRYPGPRHVLDLADSLALTEAQRPRIGALLDLMRSQAIRLGERIIEHERELDRAFAGRTIDERRLRRLTDEIGRLQGELRGVHLAAHLAVTRELTPEQITKYERLRGYGSAHEH